MVRPTSWFGLYRTGPERLIYRHLPLANYLIFDHLRSIEFGVSMPSDSLFETGQEYKKSAYYPLGLARSITVLERYIPILIKKTLTTAELGSTNLSGWSRSYSKWI